MPKLLKSNLRVKSLETPEQARKRHDDRARAERLRRAQEVRKWTQSKKSQ